MRRVDRNNDIRRSHQRLSEDALYPVSYVHDPQLCEEHLAIVSSDCYLISVVISVAEVTDAASWTTAEETNIYVNIKTIFI
ncbi:hypothetical protein KGM_213455 [Danaus plexippus plexippus]|uniref:Uncharacterized protein n=1 Tax=Danaus plexippus plexippus TaxID=278856 RepID=A0A212EJH1_DANPL|nr:hypothetical protein KGM_213455 [Danaus plexippus plexippus]